MKKFLYIGLLLINISIYSMPSKGGATSHPTPPPAPAPAPTPAPTPAPVPAQPIAPQPYSPYPPSPYPAPVGPQPSYQPGQVPSYPGQSQYSSMNLVQLLSTELPFSTNEAIAYLDAFKQVLSSKSNIYKALIPKMEGVANEARGFSSQPQLPQGFRDKIRLIIKEVELYQLDKKVTQVRDLSELFTGILKIEKQAAANSKRSSELNSDSDSDTRSSNSNTGKKVVLKKGRIDLNADKTIEENLKILKIPKIIVYIYSSSSKAQERSKIGPDILDFSKYPKIVYAALDWEKIKDKPLGKDITVKISGKEYPTILKYDNSSWTQDKDLEDIGSFYTTKNGLKGNGPKKTLDQTTNKINDFLKTYASSL